MRKLKLVLLLGLGLAISGCRLILREGEVLEMRPYNFEEVVVSGEDSDNTNKVAVRQGEKPETRPELIPRTNPVSP